MSQLQTTTKQLPILPEMTEEQVALIKRTICKGATDDELALFLYQCKKKGLDPLARQIYFQKYKDRKTGEERVTIITGIDGQRSIAARSGAYAGSDEPVFDNEDKPTKATVTVYRIVEGQKCSFTGVARWNELCPPSPKDFMWQRMPCNQLGKCAEAAALRKGFPDECGNVYIKEEMEQAERPSVEHTGSGTVEIYTATAEQNSKVREWCEQFKVSPQDKPKLREAIQGKTMGEIESIVQKFGEF